MPPTVPVDAWHDFVLDLNDGKLKCVIHGEVRDPVPDEVFAFDTTEDELRTALTQAYWLLNWDAAGNFYGTAHGYTSAPTAYDDRDRILHKFKAAMIKHGVTMLVNHPRNGIPARGV